MLYILLLGSLFFLLVNFILSDYDYLHPSFIFCLVFSISEFVCVLAQKAFEITIHPETVLVILTGELIFTVISILGFPLGNRKKYTQASSYPEYINIRQELVILTIILQLAAIFYFIKYLKAISFAYDGGTRSISELISLYDVMTKFWTDLFAELNVSVPMIYRITNPIVNSVSYIALYVIVNNYIATKKVRFSHLIVILLHCILILLNGSRSPLFRLFTMTFMLFYLMQYQCGNIKKGNIKFLFKLIISVFIAIILFFVLLNFMGRTGKGSDKIAYYLFVYTGAPIVNLDNFITDKLLTLKPSLFGAQTFRKLYNYIGKLFHIASLSYGGDNPFVFSANGIEIGNVFTTFYSYLYDFSFKGIVPLTLPVALYYVFTYNKLLIKPNHHKKINLTLLFYAYLFNDLVMQFFSSRFYETVLEAPFIKLFIFTYFIDAFIIEHRIYYGSHYMRIPYITFKYPRCLKGSD